MKHSLQTRLIEVLRSQGWAHFDAEKAAEAVVRSYEEAEGHWKVWIRSVADAPDYYGVSRREDDVSVFDSLLETPAQEVAAVLNEFERRDSQE